MQPPIAKPSFRSEMHPFFLTDSIKYKCPRVFCQYRKHVVRIENGAYDGVLMR